ncbi:GntR family transcriptional regulator [Desulfomonile tiedjei]|uniref:Transcriptional regulator n=1 Tax=Desulfomonile tiedjei (strain ATCC 49306 / DSM 6799 / DCB-1) TaxID=706587 RepID=I4CE00_DESTA|nr:GntR family transcriptional regulator [Desulfomonile tiedjei]AFM27791.1 transcriptional regulator [Desulfomonile tiedjei DSM 6799]
MPDQKSKNRQSNSVQHGTSQQRVYQEIRKSIVDGTIAFGQRLSEDSLAKMFQVSRTPVREAIFQLTQEGLISKKNNSHFYVRRPSEEELEDLFDLRIVLNNLLIDKLMAHRDEHVIEALERNVEKCKSLDESDTVSLNYALSEFHSTMCAGARSPYVERFLSGMMDHMLMSRAIALEIPGVRSMLISDHEKIVAAIKAGNKAEAKRRIREHTANTKKKILQVVLKDRLREIVNEESQ